MEMMLTEKPLIWQWRYAWYCSVMADSDSKTGMGSTPTKAYNDWKKLEGEQK